MAPAKNGRVSLISLLALSRWAEFASGASGWLGMSGNISHPTPPDVARISASILQCVYGADDDDSVCAALAGSGADIVMMDGGRHFDDGYAGPAKHIIARCVERILDNRKKGPAAATETKPFCKPARIFCHQPGWKAAART